MLRKFFRLHPLQWVALLSLVFMSISSGALVWMILLSSQGYEHQAPLLPKIEKTQLPKNPFALPEEAYKRIGEGPLSLEWTAPQLFLPDLRSELQFVGKNERPDVPKGKLTFHLQLKGTGEITSITENERLYLKYQSKRFKKNSAAQRSPNEGDEKNSLGGSYFFSPYNQPTSLWIELNYCSDDQLAIQVTLQDEHGNLITNPVERHAFALRKTEPNRTSAQQWELGGYRVDSTLLVRQKARWVGPDVFFEKHGGEEYSRFVGRQRIDFLDGDSAYSCFVKMGDFLVWDQDRWMDPVNLEKTQDKPLLAVKKIDEKVMVFELWDPDGKSKCAFSIIRAKDYEPLPDLSQEFRFVGAKTWAQFIVECRGQRMILKAHDWLVLTKEEGWTLIRSPEEVDQFVSQKLHGPLFVVDKMVKQNGRQILTGHLFNSTRTELQEVELLAAQSPQISSYSQSLTLPPQLKGETLQEMIKAEER